MFCAGVTVGDIQVEIRGSQTMDKVSLNIATSLPVMTGVFADTGKLYVCVNSLLLTHYACGLIMCGK